MKMMRNYLYNVFFQLFSILVPLITAPYVARVIGPKGAGINAFTNSILQYFILFGSIGISLYGNREIARFRDNKTKTSQLFWEIFILRVTTLGLAAIAFCIFLELTPNYHIYYLMQALGILSAVFDISWFFMGQENFRVTVVRNTLVKIISIILIFTLVKTKNDLAIYIMILSLSQLFGNLTFFPYLRKYITLPHFHDLHILRHLQPTIVLFIPQIATQIYLVLNKNMVGKMVSVTASGYYAYADQIIKMLLAIVTATGTVMLPHVANSFSKGNIDKVHQYLYQSFDFVSFTSIPLMFGIAAVSPTFSVMFFGSSFKPVGSLMMIESLVVLLIAWSNVLGVQYLLPTNQNKRFTLSVTVGAVSNILLNIPFILLWQTNGAMVATVLSELGVTVTQMFMVRKQIQLHLLFTNLWKYMLAGAVMFTAVLAMNIHFGTNYRMLFLEILFGAVIYIGLMILLKVPLIRQARPLIHKILH